MGVQQTPEEVVQRQRLRIIAVMNYEAELNEEFKAKQEEQERDMRRQQQRMTR